MTTPNEAILDGKLRHIHWLERYKTGLVKQIVSLLNKADKDLVAQIAARLTEIEGRGNSISKDETKRLESMLDEIRAQRVSLSSLMHDETRDQLNQFAIQETDFHKALIEKSVATIGKTIEMAVPSLGQLKAVVSSRPFQGRLLKEWYSDLATDTGKRVSDAVKIGLVQGQTTDQIVRRIVGTRINQFRDGILEISRRDAEAVVRTAVAHVSNNASEELYAANDDLVMGVQWVSTLDSRTTAICASRDGTVFPVNSGPRPPAHWRCRSTTIPYLGDEDGGQRASAFGPVPSNVKYQDWLKMQSPKVQDEILGPARGKLFRDGGLDIDKFVDVTGKEYNLDQLKAMNEKAYDQAFSPRKADVAAVQKENLRGYLGSKTYDNFKGYVENAIENSGVADYGMTEAEKVAIYAYTSGEKYYVRLNKALRSERAGDIARVSRFADVLDSALSKLPKYDGITSRVTKISPETLENIVKTGQYIDKGYMSSSTSQAPSWVNGNVEFNIIAKTPRLIHGYSQFPHENEALFQRARKFDVLQITKRPGGKTLIEMVESNDKD